LFQIIGVSSQLIALIESDNLYVVSQNQGATFSILQCLIHNVKTPSTSSIQHKSQAVTPKLPLNNVPLSPVVSVSEPSLVSKYQDILYANAFIVPTNIYRA
jgi:hypothetical protein